MHWPYIGQCSSIEKIECGAVNVTYKIHARYTYFLRCYQTLTDEQILQSHQIQRSLAVQLPFVIAPCFTDKALTLIKFNGASYALYPAAHGNSMSKLSSVQAKSAGFALALVHSALVQHDGSAFPSITLSWEKEACLLKLETIIKRIRQAPTSVDNYWAMRRAEKQQEYLANKNSVHQYKIATQRQLIHGDYHQANLFFDRYSAVSGLIDWDLLQNMPRAYDVIRACTYMFQMDPLLSSAFIGGYMSQLPLTGEELIDGARAWGIYADHHIWPLEQVYLHNNVAAKRFIPHQDFLPFSQQWCRLAHYLKNDKDIR
ncbi:phosphotransferase [Salinivibrio costicola]|uniref:Phosphotransferase n=1 Tax=Salinivibrio costicola TaxID=51367 RepID=A0ABX6K754_SALCS|nr:phosphotransferase [Salinivibrio costicola]QIR06091.1 phosphotransferase [Salinivibrio costicola]